MKLIHFAEQQMSLNDAPCTVSYALTVETLFTEDHMAICEQFGVSVTLRCGASRTAVTVGGITTHLPTAERLLALLARHAVLPAHLRDIVDDFLVG